MNNKKKENGIGTGLVLVLQVSLQMLVPIIICTIICWLISKKTGMTWLIIVGIIVGIIAGFNGVYKLVKGYTKPKKSPGQLKREQDEKNKDDK